MARVRVPVTPDQPVETPQAPPAASVQQLLTKNNIVIAAVVLVVLGLFLMLLNDRNQLKKEIQQQSSSQSGSNGQSEALKYQEEIGKIAELPSGQTPTLVKVSDAQKLASENPFFKNAKDGDVVLLYVSQDKSARAVLYRPSTKKVIEVTSSASIGANAPTDSTKR